jgi:hypothetical protein
MTAQFGDLHNQLFAGQRRCTGENLIWERATGSRIVWVARRDVGVHVRHSVTEDRVVKLAWLIRLLDRLRGRSDITSVTG